jgi:hypothetical protein
MKIYLATWLLDYPQCHSLSHVENRNRLLLSYYLFQEESKASDYPDDALRMYVKTGVFEPRKSRR